MERKPPIDIILCSFTNGSNNGGSFETCWICPNCRDFNIIDYEDNNAWCYNGSDCFNFNIKEIEGLNSYYTKNNDYSLLNNDGNPILKNLIIQKNIESKYGFRNYDYYDYLRNNNIIKSIDENLFNEHKDDIDKIKPPFGFDCIVVYTSNDYNNE